MTLIEVNAALRFWSKASDTAFDAEARKEANIMIRQLTTTKNNLIARSMAINPPNQMFYGTMRGDMEC